MTPARPAMPHARWWKIAFRTAHLMTTGVLVGGHAFEAPTAPLVLAPVGVRPCPASP